MFANKYKHRDYSAENTHKDKSWSDYHGEHGVSHGPS